MNRKILVVFVFMFLFSGMPILSLISVDASTTYHFCPSQSTQRYTANISTGYMDRTLSVFSNETVTLEPTDDTFVRPDYPWQNYGYGDYLWVDSRVTFLKFNLSSIPSYVEVIFAELQLCLDENLAGEDIIVESFLYSNNSWTENDLTWDDVDWDAISQSPSDNATLFYAETWTWKSWNITYCVRNALGENVSITLMSISGSGGLFSSKERLSGIYSPRLTINYTVPIQEGTLVGGIIWENTTWTLENSPYIITDTVQIPVNVTLTIEPGVTIMRPTSGDMFLLHGTLFAHGTINEKIVFDGGGNSEFFTTWGGEGNAFLDCCIIRNGYRFWNRGGYFNLTRSELNNLTDEILLESPSADIYIEYNKFVNTGGLNAYQAAGRTCKISVRYNLFQNISSSINNAGGSPGRNEMIVKFNSFINIDEIILSLALDFDTAVMNATENYWGTLDTDLIDSKIYDRNDDIRIKNYIDYLPILLEPHFDTPKISSTIYVDDDNTAGPWDGTVEHPYQNITQGLYHALKNETIFVCNGTYYENVVVNKTIVLIGEDTETTIIDGSEIITPVVHITANNVTVTAFTIQNGGRIYGWEGGGIYVTDSSRNNIVDNTITNTQYGINLRNSTNNIIIGNTIIENDVGIQFLDDYSSNNTIYHNNFTDNGWQFNSFAPSNNTWDNGYPSGGNYWSDYEGRYPNATEIDGSGIWDTPYVIDENNQDNYPIVPEFPSFLVLPLFMIATLLAVIVYRRKHSM